MRRKDEPGWLRRAVSLSILLHVVGAIVAHCGIPHAADRTASDLVDIELAPEAPKALALPDVPDEAPAAAAQVAEATPPEAAPDQTGDIVVDAGVPDAQRIARADAGHRDAAQVAMIDAGVGDGGQVAMTDDGGVGDGGQVAIVDDGGLGDGASGLAGGAAGDGGQVAMLDDGGVPRDGGVPDDGGVAIATGETTPGGGTGTGSGTGDTPGIAGSGSGSDSDPLSGDDRPHPGADDGVATGTASNLLSYFPAGQVVTVLVRFDRLRGTEWGIAGEKILTPMPDYQMLIGPRRLRIADLFETLVISTSNPQNIVSTTLVGRTTRSSEDVRDILDQSDAPVTWSVARGGALGRRGAGDRVYPGDPRVFLMPFRGWVVLAQPRDLGDLTRGAKGNLDTAVAVAAEVPAWLARARTIEVESGVKEGPELMMTMSALAGRYNLPDLGLGVPSLPAPDRITLALKVEPNGVIARGNLRFASDADAAEMVKSIATIREKVAESRILQAVLRRASALNMISGLTMVQTKNRVSYATSLSTADMRAFMAFIAASVADHYAPPPRGH